MLFRLHARMFEEGGDPRTLTVADKEDTGRCSVEIGYDGCRFRPRMGIALNSTGSSSGKKSTS